jgi:hypothetical protein
MTATELLVNCCDALRLRLVISRNGPSDVDYEVDGTSRCFIERSLEILGICGFIGGMVE